MDIQIVIKNTELRGTLDATAAGCDFASMLFTLTLTDFHATERICDLPGRLATAGTPPGTEGSAGDITYYAPWGNLALSYRDFEYSDDLVRLGRLDPGAADVLGPPSPTARPSPSTPPTDPGDTRRRTPRMESLVNPTYDYTGQVALVTGAGSGMGLATAQAFAQAGAAVVLCDINTAALDAATGDLRDQGHQVLGLTCDVSNEAQVAAVTDQAVATFGRLDMAFNNAGIQAPPSDAADELGETFDRVNAVNLRGVWACMKHELRHMREQGAGAIVNCSSLGGLVGLPGRAAYHASKHGVIGLTSSAALEYAPRGVRINAICPGPFETPMVADMIARGELNEAQAVANQPIGRLGRADEIASTVLWLCSPGASFVIGVALPVDGGYTAQ